MPRAKHPIDDDRFELRLGPYRPPRVRRGGSLFCENLGSVKVLRFSDGPIPWPMGTVGGLRRSAFVLCGDLVRAVRQEANGAVAKAWGVSGMTVSKWRRILGVEKWNPGTHRVFVNYLGKSLTSENRARGRAIQTPEKQIEWGRKRSEEGRTRKRQWKPKEEKMLGTMPDVEVARRLGCSAQTVSTRRRELGIPTFLSSPGVAASLASRADGATLIYSPAKLRSRRLELGLFQTRIAAQCGWSAPTRYQRLESGVQTRAEKHVLERVAQALNCALKDILI